MNGIKLFSEPCIKVKLHVHLYKYHYLLIIIQFILVHTVFSNISKAGSEKKEVTTEVREFGYLCEYLILTPHGCI